MSNFIGYLKHTCPRCAFVNSYPVSFDQETLESKGSCNFCNLPFERSITGLINITVDYKINLNYLR